MRSAVNQVLSGHIKKESGTPIKSRGVTKLVRYEDVSLTATAAQRDGANQNSRSTARVVRQKRRNVIGDDNLCYGSMYSSTKKHFGLNI